MKVVRERKELISDFEVDFFHIVDLNRACPKWSAFKILKQRH